MSKADSVRQKARAKTFLLQKSWIFTTQGNVWLSGTLTYPVNYEAEKDYPVVLFISGSSSQNRDKEIFEHNPFFVLPNIIK